MVTRILQLSDLHFGEWHEFGQDGNDPDSYRLANVIAEAVRPRLDGKQLDCLVLSGDLFSTSQAEDQALAEDNLKLLFATLGLDVASVACVPGNHDLTWNPSFKPLQFFDRLVKDLQVVGSSFPEVLEIAGKHGAKPLALILLDSCRLESKEMAGFGRIGETQLGHLREKLEARKISRDTHHILAVMHHHLMPIWPVYKVWDPLRPRGGAATSYSTTVDAGLVLGELARLGAIGVLHGHQHQAAVLCYRDYLRDDRDLHLFAAGTASRKADADVRRHFFLYELDDHELKAWSFFQAASNPRRFDRGDDPVRVRIPVSSPAPLCGAEASMTVSEDVESSHLDNSDLFYVLLTVVDCKESRRIIRRVLETDLPKQKCWKPGAYFNLLGMYDLLGKWDIVLRFRTNINVRNIEELLSSALLHGRQIERAQGTEFDVLDVLNVQHEGVTIEDSLEDRAKQITRRRLSCSADYLLHRCQRAFLYVHLPVKHRARLLKDLHMTLTRNRGYQGVELCSVSESALVFEILMRCSESTQIHRLNELLEGDLSRYRAQKYTLLCYGYDEAPFELPTVSASPDNL